MLEGQVLFNEPHRKNTIREIARLVGVPETHWRALYLSALERFASYVQQIPASEAHHHAGPGGLLDHTLEVITGALAARRSILLPVGASPEVLAHKHDVWTYAVFAGALLHDVGKAATSHRVILFDTRGRSTGNWDPWSGPMPAGMRYRVEFVRDRKYGLHTRVAPLLVHHILPSTGISWLGADPEVLAPWLALVAGDIDGAAEIGCIVARADGDSVARNLGADGSRFAAARARPLHEKLLTALRYLIAEGGLPINRDGAAAWITEEDVWLVSKRVADALREHLIAEGHEGIPTRNDRIFDVLQEHGILKPNGDRAVWLVRVKGEGWEKPHDLTLLRIPVARLWPNPDARHSPFAGQITPLSTSPDSEAIAPAIQPELRSNISAAELPPQDGAERQPRSSRDEAPIDEGERFLQWLRAGVTDGTMKVNQADARVHVVSEGVLLVSPGIFHDYARAAGDFALWERAQKRLLKRRLHLLAEGGTNIISYRVERASVNHKCRLSLLKGIVLRDIAVVFGDAKVACNPVLLPIAAQSHRVDEFPKPLL